MSNESRKKIIIDTDIGGDIDDAFALMLAMQIEEFDIVGVTTVYCDTRLRAKIAKRLLRLGGRDDVPVYAGERKPLKLTKLYGKTVNYEEKPSGYSDEYEDEVIRAENAVDFIIRTLEESETKISFVTLGALTNIGKVIETRPDLTEKIEEVFIMGGAYGMNFCEYNFACDPLAADIVLNSGIKKYCVGVDVTFRCFPSESQLQKLKSSSSPCVKMLFDMIELWGRKVFFHDPLALMCAHDKSYIKWEKRLCRVENDGEFTSGMVVNISDMNWGNSPEQSVLYVAVDVDEDGFVNDCMEKLYRY